MAKIVVTITRQLGTQGDVIAHEVARALRATLIDRETVRKTLDRVGVSAHLDDRFEAVVEQAANELVPEELAAKPENEVAEAIKTPPPIIDLPRPLAPRLDLPRAAPSHDESVLYQKVIQSLISEVSLRGKRAVIIGRGGAFVLKNAIYSLHVFLYATQDERVRIVTREYSVSERAAKDMIAESDRNRSGFIQKTYGADWLSPAHYDLSINTGKIPAHHVAQAIVQAAQGVENDVQGYVHAQYERLSKLDSLTVKEAADLLAISPDIIRHAVFAGELHVPHTGGYIRHIERQALNDWLHQRALD